MAVPKEDRGPSEAAVDRKIGRIRPAQVIQGPAPQALPKIAVSAQNGEVVPG